MAIVASRELRNSTRALLDRVNAGEELTITVDGREVARLTAVSSRPRWISKSEFIDRFVGFQADSALTAELHEMMPDTTDDLPFY